MCIEWKVCKNASSIETENLEKNIILCAFFWLFEICQNRPLCSNTLQFFKETCKIAHFPTFLVNMSIKKNFFYRYLEPLLLYRVDNNWDEIFYPWGSIFLTYPVLPHSFMIFRVRILIEDKTISKSIVLELEFEILHARSTHLVTYCAASEVAEATCIESQFFLAHPVPQIFLSSNTDWGQKLSRKYIVFKPAMYYAR